MLKTGGPKKTQPKQERKSVKSWLKGYVSQLDDGRMPEDGLATAANVVLSQNGTVRPAYSSATYGTQPPGSIQGQVYPFTRLVGGNIVNYVCALINVAGVVKLYYQTDGGAWTAAGGTNSFTVTASGRFAQVKSVVLVASGTDYMCWLDTSTLAMVLQTALSTPSAPTPTVVAALVGTNYTYRYRISAVNVGESIASTAATPTTLVQRDVWNPSTQYIDLVWSRVTGATAYNVYLGTIAGEEVLLGAVADPGSGSVTFRDDGSVATDITRVAPDTDTSRLPIVSYVRVLNDRPYAWGDTADRWKIWYGGTGASTLKFNATYGGGWTRVANGSPYIPNNVSMFRTGKGDPAITVFCRAMAGQGKRFIMTENTTTEGDTTITVMGVQEDNGAYGSDSPDGVVMAEDDIFYPSKDSFKKTGNKVNVPNILSSKGISDGIQVDVEALNSLYMHKCVGLYYQGRIYWAVPYGGATSNNQIWTLDLTRGGAWMLPMDVSADWMWLYEDSSGLTHFCYLSDDEILEFSYSLATTRNGTAFPTSVGSGLIKFSDDGQEWANVEKIKFILIRPQGNITANVTGKTEDAPVASVGSEAFNPETSISGIGEESIGMYYIGEARDAPSAYGSQREELEVEIDEDVQWLQWRLNSTGTGVDYELSDAIIYFTPVGIKD